MSTTSDVIDSKEQAHMTEYVDSVPDIKDEGFKVLAAAEDTSPVTEEENLRVQRKVDLRIMPIIWLTLGIQYCDKTALGTAALFGIVQDLGLYKILSLHPTVLSTKRYSNAVMIFFVGYTIGAFPLGYLAQRYPIAKVCTVFVILWGMIFALTPACTSYHGLLVQRFFLGIMESGINPAFVTILAGWYTKREQSLRAPVLNSAPGFFVPIFLGFVYGVTLIGNPAHAWKVMYYFVGGATILWSAAIILVLPDSQRSARFLTEREKFVAVERLHSNQATISSPKFRFSQIKECLTDLKVWLLVAGMFCLTAPTGASGSFSPLVINKVYGATGRHSLLLLMPSGAISGTVSLLAGVLALYNSKRGRILILLVCALISFTGFLLEWRAPLSNKKALLTGVYLIVAYAGSFSIGISLSVSNVSGATKRTFVGALLFISNSLSGVAAPYYFATGAPRYLKGFEITACLLVVGMGLMIAYAFVCHRENKRRDALGTANIDHAFEDRTDKENLAFRYVF